MKKPPSKPLREELRSAINQRKASLHNGRCKRKDFRQIEVSIGKAETWLGHFPFASDQSVVDWCRDHHTDLGRIVIGNNHRQLQKLLMASITPKPEPKVIEMRPTATPAA